jgi:ribosomal protein L34E
MGLFEKKSKKIVISGTVCQICGMSFAATDRLVRHMVKAHGKVKRNYGPSCQNC